MLAEGTGKAPSHRRLFDFSDSPTRTPQLTQYWLTTPGDERNKPRLELDAERLVPLAGVTTAGSSPRGTTPRPVDALRGQRIRVRGPVMQVWINVYRDGVQNGHYFQTHLVLESASDLQILERAESDPPPGCDSVIS